MNRRHFLKTSVVLTGASLTAGSLFAQPKDYFISNGGENPPQHLTAYPDTAGGKHQLFQLWVRNQNNIVLTSYRAHKTLKYPYFYPVTGPLSGLSLTAESAMPWPHHRSIFFGLDRVNGGNYWQDSLSRGQIISQGPSFVKEENGKFKIDSTGVEISDRCLWVPQGEPEPWNQTERSPIIEDQRRFVIKILDERRYILDADIVIKALTDIKVEQTNHSLFGVRCAPDIAPTGGGILVNAEGVQGQANTLGKPSRWMAFYGKRAGVKGEVVEGIAVFCPSKAPHPVFENCPWFTRDYGNCSPTPMLWLPKDKPFLLPEGDELKLRYRVVAFGGTPKEADLDGLWNQFDTAAL
ncbi:MAG: PmoA family protein [Planctomycetaceae bacterium]|jgi:hypothetical protein|nr:PmoA family protein [Planctomycetaceae bacterium]